MTGAAQALSLPIPSVEIISITSANYRRRLLTTSGVDILYAVTFGNVDPKRDIVFAEGPVDELDHSASQDFFGSKMEIFGAKWRFLEH